MTELTNEGAAALRRALFPEARIAAFDGDRRVTDWQRYDPDGDNTLRVHGTGPNPARVTHLRLERTDGHGHIEWPIHTPITPGDTVGPPPDPWIVVDDNRPRWLP